MRRVACDEILFTDDWIPDHELGVMAGLELDPGTRGPRVDTGLRTAQPGLFAAGNLLHGAEPADLAALSGRHAAASVVEWLDRGTWSEQVLPLVCKPPLRWISPNALATGLEPPPRGRFLVRAEAWLHGPTLEVRQGERMLWRRRVRRLMPGRSTPIPCGWIRAVDLAGAPIEILVRPR
jgi:hypothetical protein